MKDLTVSDFGVTALNGVPVVSSRKVAEIFNKRHDHVLRDVKNVVDSLPKNGESDWRRNFIESTYKERGKRYPEYLLTRDGFTLLAMGFNGKMAIDFKVRYINRFNEMEQYIKSREVSRLESRELTDSIKVLHDPPKHYHYSNEFDMINRIVLGMSSKQFRLQHGISKDMPIRDYLNLQQIDEIQKLQNFDAHLAKVMPDYKQRQKLLKEYYLKICNNCHTGLTGSCN